MTTAIIRNTVYNQYLKSSPFNLLLTRTINVHDEKKSSVDFDQFVGHILSYFYLIYSHNQRSISSYFTDHYQNCHQCKSMTLQSRKQAVITVTRSWLLSAKGTLQVYLCVFYYTTLSTYYIFLSLKLSISNRYLYCHGKLIITDL